MTHLHVKTMSGVVRYLHCILLCTVQHIMCLCVTNVDTQQVSASMVSHQAVQQRWLMSKLAQSLVTARAGAGISLNSCP